MIKHKRGNLHRLPITNVVSLATDQGCAARLCTFRSTTPHDYVYYVLDSTKSNDFKITDVQPNAEVWPFCRECARKYDDVTSN